MTRRGLREQVFKMLFRVEFHNVEDMPEQMNMFEEVEECSEKDKEYISNKFHNIVEKIDEIDAGMEDQKNGKSRSDSDSSCSIRDEVRG